MRPLPFSPDLQGAHALGEAPGGTSPATLSLDVIVSVVRFRRRADCAPFPGPEDWGARNFFASIVPVDLGRVLGSEGRRPSKDDAGVWGGALPPSSIAGFRTWSAADFRSFRPTPVDPVKLTTRTAGVMEHVGRRGRARGSFPPPFEGQDVHGGLFGTMCSPGFLQKRHEGQHGQRVFPTPA